MVNQYCLLAILPHLAAVWDIFIMSTLIEVVVTFLLIIKLVECFLVADTTSWLESS